tara:strand:- start:200 stop:454 length:255 start_codon:yes stop_codon:yes gene_type:complete
MWDVVIGIGAALLVVVVAYISGRESNRAGSAATIKSAEAAKDALAHAREVLDSQAHRDQAEVQDAVTGDDPAQAVADLINDRDD